MFYNHENLWVPLFRAYLLVKWRRPYSLYQSVAKSIGLKKKALKSFLIPVKRAKIFLTENVVHLKSVKIQWHTVNAQLFILPHGVFCLFLFFPATHHRLESQNGLGWKRSQRWSVSNSPAMSRAATHQIKLPRSPSKLDLNTSRDAASTTLGASPGGWAPWYESWSLKRCSLWESHAGSVQKEWHPVGRTSLGVGAESDHEEQQRWRVEHWPQLPFAIPLWSSEGWSRSGWWRRWF